VKAGLRNKFCLSAVFKGLFVEKHFILLNKQITLLNGDAEATFFF